MNQKQYSLIEYQHSLLSEALLCQPTSKSSTPNNLPTATLGWKILIFDTPSQQTLSSQYKVKDLRERSITLYMNITQKREQLYGVTALYLVQPTLENINLILRDFQEDLYSCVRIHFSSEPSPHALSTLAKSIADKYPKQLNKIQNVSYSYLGYHAVENSVAFASTETELANLLCQFKEPPVFLYQKQEESFARSVKQKLDSFQNPSLFPEASSGYYTCCLVLNREVDFTPVLYHGITYCSLMCDVYQMLGYNKVRVSSKKEDTYEFDSKDEVWSEKKHHLISEFQLDKQISRIRTRLGTLKENMDEFTELTEKNKRLDWHLSRANELIRAGGERQLNNYSMVETDLLTFKKLSKENKRLVMELLQSAGTREDKTRLLLLYMLTCEDLSSLEELQKLVGNPERSDLYKRVKDRRLKELSQKDGSNKFIKSLAKGLLQGLISNQKKFVVTSLAEQILRVGNNGIQEIAANLGLEALEARRVGGMAKLKRLVVYVRGGICFNEQENLDQMVGGVYYCGDKLVTGKELVA